MSNYAIVTDSCCDLPFDYVKEQGIDVIPLHLKIGENIYKDDLGQSISSKEFFTQIENGALPMTSQPTPDEFYRVFKKTALKGQSVLYIGVSSGLSGTFNSSNIAKQMVEEEVPDAHIVCFTTFIGSLGQALFVMKAIEMQKEGKSLEDVVSFLSEKVESQKNLIVVNDLSHLKRGGRISGIQSVIGTALKVNPVLQIDKQEGKVQVVDKIRGRKKAINKLVEFIIENIEESESQIIAISHSNALEEVEKIVSEVSDKIQVKEFVIGSIGPVVGSHSGVGAIAVFFLN